MPLFSNENVETDWYSEQVRGEINRLREVLHNPHLTAEERAIARSQLANYVAGPEARRSTRIPAPVRLKIVGQSRVGTPQTELTSAVAVNCHGCLCLSRHEYARDSWMTLEVSNLHTGRKSAAVRAKVRFIRLPGNPRELYRVGVELEKPANIWGIESVPEDWFPYSNPARVAAGATQGTSPAPEIRIGAQTEQIKRIPAHSSEFGASALVSSTPESATSQPGRGKIENPATMPDELNRARETKLRETAEHVVISAVASPVNTALKEAVKTTEIASQESILKITDGVRDCDTILVPARVGFLSRLNDELASACERLFEWAAAFLTKSRTIPQSFGVENGAERIQPGPVDANGFSKKLVSGQVSVRAGRDVRYWIKIDTSKMLEPAVTGWFRASGGSTSDIALVLSTEREFENLIHGREARVVFAIDSIKAGEFHVSIAQSGTYILALNNRFSLFMPRTFTANICLRYSTA